MQYPLVAALCALSTVVEAVSLSVTTGCNIYTGLALPNGISYWLGVRYAAPPIGDLRFMPPQDPPCNNEVQLATEHGKVCLATNSPLSETTNSEDCLFLDIYAPSNATSSSKFPVFFFIQGGGFNVNGNPNLNGAGLIAASGYSMVVVTLNYRVGPYGFLTDGHLITANNGLRDQIKALEWVHEHISQFGGNPDHVVLGGSSAGAASISLLLAKTGRDRSSLFHAAAAESISFAPVRTVEQSQYQYENLAIRLGCVGSAQDSLDCLRSKPIAEFQAANIGIPYPGASSAPLYMYNPTIDGDLIIDYTYNVYAKGNFMRVPILSGDDTNGGTVFVPSKTSTLGESDAFLKNQFPKLTLEQIGKINELFPNPNQTCPNLGCYWRQASNAYGELRYMCPNLYVASAFAKYGTGRTFNYRYNVEDPKLLAQGYGVPHTTEINPLFGPENIQGDPPTSYYSNGTNAMVVPVIQSYWTSFIRTFDPNKHRYPGTAIWEPYTREGQLRMLFETGGRTVMESVENGLRSRCEYLTGIGLDIQQ
ncbi:Alpha/Beta hydrolase protein [Pseudomassariella vexata]|uniref:Carboxylic ester hydrolase n=1 Tax=Pseudomassariella vexata TaxID=1141098 RepID=A0A1Y2DF51_9PEZI|nr:Alpha/Beta hydrolase protein [Pseudomassariella vexata]ORY57901.1 Alpha/Beta hydrolase protein [Pseudomassariella vexata]